MKDDKKTEGEPFESEPENITNNESLKSELENRELEKNSDNIDDDEKLDLEEIKELDPIEIIDEIEEIQDPEQKIKAYQKALSVSYRFSGPIPDPSTFENYEKILPGAANRILSMAEKEQDNKIDCDKGEIELKKTSMEYTKSDIDKSFKLANRLLYLGIVIILVFLFAGVYLLLIGKDVAGYFSLGVALISGFFGPIKIFFNTPKNYLPSSVNESDKNEKIEIEE